MYEKKDLKGIASDEDATTPQRSIGVELKGENAFQANMDLPSIFNSCFHNIFVRVCVTYRCLQLPFLCIFSLYFFFCFDQLLSYTFVLCLTFLLQFFKLTDTETVNVFFNMCCWSHLLKKQQSNPHIFNQEAPSQCVYLQYVLHSLTIVSKGWVCTDILNVSIEVRALSRKLFLYFWVVLLLITAQNHWHVTE